MTAQPENMPLATTAPSVKKANQSEELLIYFSRGIRIAKKLGNEYLINMAYQKNIMLSSTNGMYEISLLYSVRTYEALKDKRSIQAGRIYSGIAYNLCAIGENERAMAYYRHAIRLFYHLREPEDIAEVMVFLASDSARGVNGNIMFVDGGTDALLNSEKVY